MEHNVEVTHINCVTFEQIVIKFVSSFA